VRNLVSDIIGETQNMSIREWAAEENIWTEDGVTGGRGG
jgi:hypothetical protein